ncbi:MAG: bifunctional DNA-formamidopyrimidine glycosylase/DNA-(apurinic or apyrimidinic site) lyase [Candidatus Pacebacteria bacterium]|nr:bifunctional DNA-formamidopyrimidine glycosylase/DNA-(apurinic or apyrimidinic site) lyase [Candidatus Paceibacterota bacterium]
MPELPEVETIVRDLDREVRNRTFLDTWTDARSLIKKDTFESFKKKIVGKKILKVKRRAKNILIDLYVGYVLLVHQKIAGHLLLGEWKLDNGKWIAEEEGPLSTDPMNRFLHVVFSLDDKRQLALSDARKFAKIELWKKEELENSKEFKELGPEPLEKNFTLDEFEELFKKKKGKIKQVLMDQNFISGIGNIYASEILFEAKIHPEEDVSKLNKNDLGRIYKATRRILEESIKLKGDSFSDFRTIYGEKGKAQEVVKVYQKEGGKCPRCKGLIKRIKQGGRSSFFCPQCQIKK